MNRAYQLSLTEEAGADGARRRHVGSADPAAPPAYELFIHAYFETRMLASGPVRDAAQELREAAEELSGLKSGDEKIAEVTQHYNSALRAFDAAARTELGIETIR